MEETPSKNNPDANLNELLGKGISLDHGAMEKYGAIADKAVRDILQKTRPDGSAFPVMIRDNMSEIISKTISEMGSKSAVPEQPVRSPLPVEVPVKEEPVIEEVKPVLDVIPDVQVEERVEPLQRPEPVPQSEPVQQSGTVSSHVEENRVVLDISDEQMNSILADALKEHDKVADELTVRNLVDKTPFQEEVPVEEIIMDQPEPVSPEASTAPDAADVSHHDVLNELSRTIEETVVPEEPIQQDMIDALVREAGMGNAGGSFAVDAPAGQGTPNIEEDIINQILQSQPELAQSGGIAKEPDMPVREELPGSPVYTEEPAITKEPEIAASAPLQKETPAQEGYKQHELPSSFVIRTAIRVLWQGLVKFISGLLSKTMDIIAFPFKEAYLVLEHFKEILPVITVLIGIFWLVLGLISPSSVVPFVLSVIFLLPNIVHAYNSHTSK